MPSAGRKKLQDGAYDGPYGDSYMLQKCQNALLGDPNRSTAHILGVKGQSTVTRQTPLSLGNIPAPIFLYSSQPVAHKIKILHYAHAIQLRDMYVVVWIMNVSRIQWLSFILQKDAIFLVIDHAAPQFNFSHVLPTTYTIQLHHPRIS